MQPSTSIEGAAGEAEEAKAALAETGQPPVQQRWTWQVRQARTKALGRSHLERKDKQTTS
jgi:hypothetical protein